RSWKRIEKKDRRNLKMWAEGAREEILKPHIAPYTDALERGWRAERDYLRLVCNEFHARISWRLRDEEEPEEPLPEYDPLAIPEVEELDVEETAAKRERVDTLNARIGRWLKYRARRLRKPMNQRDPRKDPWAGLLAKLSGITPPHKARQGFQQYMRESYDSDIEPVVQARWQATCTGDDGTTLRTKGMDANFRASVARDLFKELPVEEQDALRLRARQEALSAREEYELKARAPPSKSPEDKQRCIDNLGPFMTNVLRGVHDHTGLSAFVVFGGPIPAQGGELRTVTVSYGRSLGAGGCFFPQWVKPRFDRDVLDFMREWLKTAYTPKDCEEAALTPPQSEDLLEGARYRMSDTDDLGWGKSANSDDESDSSSSSGEEFESGADSDAEADVRGSKKSSQAKKPKEKTKTKGKGKGKEKEVE
ncbi:hypothetical protein R3P38DRAFT_2416383, partial [Favolaschia claudopus]